MSSLYRKCPRLAVITMFLVTVAFSTGCSDDASWKSLQVTPAVEYAVQPVMGLISPQIEFGGRDTIWIIARGVLLHSPDGGKRWSKRLVEETTGSEFDVFDSTVKGTTVWLATACRVVRSSDSGMHWVESASVPECEGGPLGGLAVSGNRVWLATAARLFETDGRLTHWTEPLWLDSDTTAFSDIISSDRWVWLLGENDRIYFAPVQNPGAFHEHELGTEYTLRFASASGDTIFIHHQASELEQPDLFRLVVTAQEQLQELDASPLREHGTGPVALPQRLWWVTQGKDLFHFDSAGRRQRVLTAPTEIEVVNGTSERALAITAEGAVAVSPRGDVINRLFEPSGSACAVERRGDFWYMYLNDGSTSRADSTFLWEWPGENPDLSLAACAVGRTVWAVRTELDGENLLSRTSLLRRSGERWITIRGLTTWERRPPIWIHADGDRIWAMGRRADGELQLVRSLDDGRRWDSVDLSGIIQGSLHGFGSQIWALRETSLTDSAAQLVVLAGARSGKAVLKAPPASNDAWMAGDSVWIATDNFIHFTADWGENWEQRAAPSGESLYRIVKSGPVLSVRAGTPNAYGWYSSTDAGINWNSDLGFEEVLPGTGSAALPWEMGSATAGMLVPRTIFPRIVSYRITHSLTQARLEIQLDTTTAAKGTIADSFSFELGGVDAHDRTRGEYDTFKDACRREESVARWTCTFSPEAAGIRPGDEGYLRLTLRRGEFRHAYPLPAFTFLPLWRRLPSSILWAVAGYSAILIVAVFLYLLKPLWLHRLYWTLRRYAGQLPWLTGTVAATVIDLLLPFLARHPRVLDAWVEKHAERIDRAFRQLDARLIPPEQYVPLPVDVLRAGAGGSELVVIRRITEPTAEAFRPFFEGKRTLLEILGSGGSGKTTLALRVVGWGLGRSEFSASEERLTRHRLLPVWVDEETKDLLQVAVRQTSTWAEEDVPEEFVRTLLRAGRILVVLDRLSERSAEMQGYVRRAQGQLRVQRMLVTTRAPLTSEAPVTTYLRTRELTFESLARLVSARLAVTDPDPLCRPDELPRPHPCWTAEKQAELTSRITRLFRVSSEGGDEMAIPLQPLLARIAVDEAAMLRKGGSSSEALTQSIPRLIQNYLVSLNPADADEDGLSDAAMLRVAQLAATLELGEKYRPRSFSRAEARTEFALHGWNIDTKPDPLQRLILNGVLVDEGAGYMRFRLDPVAEFVAADAAVQDKAHDQTAWQSLLDSVSAAEADSYYRLLIALRQIRLAQSDP